MVTGDVVGQELVPLTRAARKVALVVAAVVLLALLAPVPHGTVRHAPATQPATYPVTVLGPLPDGSTLDDRDCARLTFIDDPGPAGAQQRPVHRNREDRDTG